MKNFFHNFKVMLHDLDSYICDDRHVSKKTKNFLLIFISVLVIFFVVDYVYLKIHKGPYSNITELINNNEYGLADKELSELLKKNPDDVYFLILAARANIGLSENTFDIEMRNLYLSKARSFLVRAEKISPDYTEVYRMKGLMYVYMGEFVQAEMSYKKMFTLSEPTSKDWSDLGRVYLMQGDVTSAPDSFNKALKLDPNNEDAQIGNIRVLVFQNKNDVIVNVALPIYNKTSDKKNKLQLAEIIGNAYSKLTKYNDAKKYFDEGLALDSNSVSINYGLAELSFYSSFDFQNTLESTKEAKTLVEKAIQLDPLYPYSYALLTRIADATNNKPDYDKYLNLTKEKLKDYPFMNTRQKEVFLKTIPEFNKSSGNVTIKVLSVKSTPGVAGENNILNSK
jgi:tetratricopeptide (TPR) repeat protein